MDIDSKILGKFQKLSDWAQNIFGVDNFGLAKLCIYIASIATFMSFICQLGNNKNGNGEPCAVCVLWVVAQWLINLYWYWIIKNIEKQYYNNPNFKNISEISEKPFRLPMFICFIMVGVLFVVTKFLITNPQVSKFFDCFAQTILIWVALSMYFRARTPKPPIQSKVSKFLQKVVGILSGIVGAPAH